jgi:hypothetical protein
LYCALILLASAQLASLGAALAQFVLQRRAIRRARNAAVEGAPATDSLAQQERDLDRQAQLGWAPAHDSRWLAEADVQAVAWTWAWAAPYADTDPAAAAALHKCEDRLRQLHPYAMARYDRLRAACTALPSAEPLAASEWVIWVVVRRRAGHLALAGWQSTGRFWVAAVSPAARPLRSHGWAIPIAASQVPTCSGEYASLRCRGRAGRKARQ